MSSLASLRTLQDKPAMAEELIYKLRAEVTNGVFLKLTDFLKLPDVIQAGITLENAKKDRVVQVLTHFSETKSKHSYLSNGKRKTNEIFRITLLLIKLYI